MEANNNFVHPRCPAEPSSVDAPAVFESTQVRPTAISRSWVLARSPPLGMSFLRIQLRISSDLIFLFLRFSKLC